MLKLRILGILSNELQEYISLPFPCIIILVTRTAVSVVICTGPSRRPSNPLFRNSAVRSTVDKSHHGVECIQLTQPLGGLSPGSVKMYSVILVKLWKEFVPRIPPNRNTRNFWPSSGQRSTDAAGSNRQTLPVLPANNCSTDACSMRMAEPPCATWGKFSDLGTDDNMNWDLDARHSPEALLYSSIDHCSNSGSRCSTTYTYCSGTCDRAISWIGGCGRYFFAMKTDGNKRPQATSHGV